jgi:hypothetical protein
MKAIFRLRVFVALTCLISASCGNQGSDLSVQSQTPPTSSAAASAPEPEPLQTPPPSSAAAGAPAPATATPDPNVFVNVSNQSFDDPEVQVTISADGQVLLDESLPVEGQHHVVGSAHVLRPGERTLSVKSDSGAEHIIVISVSDAAPVHVFVAYWKDEAGDPYFQSEVQDQPFATG